MSRTRRGQDKVTELERTTVPYKREERRKLLREFEREYIGSNRSPYIEL